MAAANHAKPVTIHFLRDGTMLESIEGHVVKMEDCPDIYWQMYMMNEERANKLGLHIEPHPALVAALKKPRKPLTSPEEFAERLERVRQRYGKSETAS